MSIELYANNALTTLAANISSTQTTILVATGTGLLFPNPAAGQYFRVTLANGSTIEICYCTNVTGDTFTVSRGQENTIPSVFSSGNPVGNFNTDGAMSHLVQSEQLQAGTYSYAVAGGTANALSATIASNLLNTPAGMPVCILAAYANGTPATFSLTLGSTPQGIYPIVKGDNGSLIAGDIPSAGYPLLMNWSATLEAWVLQNPATGIFVSSVPTGAIVVFPATTPPAGYLICEGQLLLRSIYANLWAYAQASGNIAATDAAWNNGQFSPGDITNTNFRIPQLGGYFIRSLDNGNGIDPSRNIGSIQGGQNVNHAHGATSLVSDPSHAHGGVTTGGGTSDGKYTTGTGPTGSPPTTFPANTTLAQTGISVATTIANQGGSETRPINIAYLYCIKY